MSLSKADEYYIDNHRDRPVDQLAKEINRSAKLVEEYLKRPVQIKPPVPINELKQGSTVMTEAASMYADELSKNKEPFDYVRENADKIFKIRPGDPAK